MNPFQPKKSWTAGLAAALLLWGLNVHSGTLLGSKHDFTGLNKRAGVVAMPTVAFSDLGSPCVYCHIPPEKGNVDSSKLGGRTGTVSSRPPMPTTSTTAARWTTRSGPPAPSACCACPATTAPWRWT